MRTCTIDWTSMVERGWTRNGSTHPHRVGEDYLYQAEVGTTGWVFDKCSSTR
jgi:hypothetical protein